MAKKKYFQKFNLVEINKTFYNLPRESTAEKWGDERPEDFEYTMKAWQLITHKSSSPTYRKLRTDISDKKKKNYGDFQPTDEVFKAWEDTATIAEKSGIEKILFQCPASFESTEENIDNMRSFFGEIDRRDFIFIWEPRGDWKPKTVKNICKDLNLIHCVDPFKHERTYGDPIYYRLHGTDSYYHTFSDEELKEVISKIESANVEEAYVLFNNVSMDEDALQFRKLLDKR